MIRHYTLPFLLAQNKKAIDCFFTGSQRMNRVLCSVR